MKTIYAININNYMPELCKITMPSIENYANKIGANLEIITERKFPDWPITYEKMQLFELSKNNEWSILIDADTVIGKELPDFTEHLQPHTIGVHMAYDRNLTLPSEYFIQKDPRNVGIVTSFMVVHNRCRKIWEPLTESTKNALRRLDCIDAESHIVDEFCVSRNLARYKIGFRGLVEISNDFLHLSATIEDNKTIERAEQFAYERV